RIQRRVAIKRLPFPSDRSGRPVAPAGLAEARTAALLNHPNIVTVHEWDTDADEAFIIMEHVDGATVADLLRVSDGPLTLDETAAVVEAVADALEFAHDNGVLHLDVKPDNVLVTRDGRVKVADFGIAALSTAAGHGHGAGGTPGYMPLEQIRGEELDERTDVWAFGVLVYEMLTDANPYYADTWEGAVFKAEVVEPPAPGEFVADLPAALDDVLLTALAPVPSDRYPGVRSLANHLLDHLGDPRAGRRSLANLVEEACGKAPCDEAEPEGIGLWDRLKPWSRPAASIASATAAAWLVWAGLTPFALGTLALGAASALVAVAAVFAPGLGLGIATALLMAGIARQGMVLAAALLFVIATATWWVFGRRGAAWLAVLSGPALGVARISPAAPLLAGFVLPPLPAAALSALGALFTMGASAASGAAAPFTDVGWILLADPWATATGAPAAGELVASPAPLMVLLGWSIAGAVMSLCCRSASRLMALLGIALGTAALTGGYLLADAVATEVNTSVTWLGQPLLLSVVASSILMVLVVAAGPPTRAEEE
ncbi:MAG: serine/threonine protein kinase, partial [Coriobacteriia bacterium]|nr:serine/threonine protein kinase [Coriobacteriia bacterium]